MKSKISLGLLRKRAREKKDKTNQEQASVENWSSDSTVNPDAGQKQKRKDNY